MKRYVMIVVFLACARSMAALDWNKIDEIVAEHQRLDAAMIILDKIEAHDLKPCEELVDAPDALLLEDKLAHLDSIKVWIQKMETESQSLAAEAIRQASTQELHDAIDRLAEVAAQVAKRCAPIELRLAKVRWCFVLRSAQALGDALILSQSEQLA